MNYLDQREGSRDDIVVDGDEMGFLIAHSIGGSPEECGYLVDFLGQRGHSVSCPMLIGHGGSRILLGATNWRHWLGTLEAAHDRLSRRCSFVFLVGYLTGACLVLKLLQDPGRPALGQILCTPSVRFPGSQCGLATSFAVGLGWKQAANLGLMVESAPFGIGSDMLRVEALSNADGDSAWRDGAFFRTAGAAVEVRRLGGIVTGQLADISTPTVIVTSREEDGADQAFSELLQRKLGGRVSVVMLDNSLYRVLEDQQRDFVSNRIAEFAHATLTEPAPPPPESDWLGEAFLYRDSMAEDAPGGAPRSPGEDPV